ncbi:hypothetical protein H9Q69_012738 [Fusarium xylarioides]|uniref:Uncharacterized protein n=1 Tax=Fusarium xylarioides TaxID=221167 RepID=A0A9P7HUM5_9HYPO|nr:hypothetical protein H9Q70_011968 [Fusarium xylarioides]KAG5762453.1 hypothetical protein H9Q72_009454 [Fusarium xylarioides]KAG5768582.1 hypothetical protein H9Q73_013797 [Fusarium xylarioides]KAG5788194.1 hypothetical protein H9Q69_012738 [Fusarium xylarioides]KAG5808555.1 hypothetical protein H9Q71_006957 [Fusarium xylarioides]
MAWPSTEDNTRLRARQLRRFHEKHISSEGPLKHADKITSTDMDLATTLAPDYSLKFCAEDEEEYPEQWVLKPKSLAFILSNFRPKAKEIVAAMDREIDAAIAGDGTTIPPVFLGGYGDREQIRSLKKIEKGLQDLLQEHKAKMKAAEEKAEQYLARAEKAETQLQELLGELDDEDRRRKKKRKILGQ